MKIVFDSKLEEAMHFAKEKHRHILRKDDKTLYWVHLEEVVNNLRSIGIDYEYILCAGWLHDTIEDTDTDYDDLAKQFGPQVADIVANVTKVKTLPEEEKEKKYIEKISRASWQAQAVKLCDIWANLADMDSGYKEEKDKVKQIEKKIRYFDAINAGLAENSSKIPKLDRAVAEINSILSRYDGIKPISLP